MKHEEIEVIRVSRSQIHGTGVFAERPINGGMRVIEYTGRKIRWQTVEADDTDFTMLFDVGRGFVLDGQVEGNEARFINHSCEPNCESLVVRGRVFIEAVREIEPGEELSYDYNLTLGKRPSREERQRFACACGAANCRGTMLRVAE